MTTAAAISIATYQDILDAMARDSALREKTRRHLRPTVEPHDVTRITLPQSQ